MSYWQPRLRATLHEGMGYIIAHPGRTAAVSLLTVLSAGVEVLKIVPAASFLVTSSWFPYVHETHDLFALALALLAAYCWAPGLGLLAIALYFGAHTPYVAIEAPRDYPEYFRLLSTGLVALLGVRLIVERSAALERAERRERQLGAVNEMTVQALNERAYALEEAEQQRDLLHDLLELAAEASERSSPLQEPQQLLEIIQRHTGAEYVSLTLVEESGVLGERADRFQGIAPVTVEARPGGLAARVLHTGESYYIEDAEHDPRANPALVKAGIRSYIGIPLPAHQRIAGILFIHSRQPDAFTQIRPFLEATGTVLGLLLQKANAP